MKPKLKPPGTKRLQLKCDVLLSTSAFKFNLRRYDKDASSMPRRMSGPGANTMGGAIDTTLVGRCRLTLSNPR